MLGMVFILPVIVVGLSLASGALATASLWHTNATFVNNATSPAADPYVRYDDKSGRYFAYTTDGADDGWYFGIYSSPDLATWEKVPGGAIKADSQNIWAEDWWWAPECYYNDKTGWYFLFHAGRYLDAHKIAKNFKYPDFEEASKIGVAVSRSPAGPFVSIAPEPLDYFPFDPDYSDVNLLMSHPYLTPPSTLAEGKTAGKGTYIPHIDPNIFWDEDGSIWLFYSRNAYRNWVWSDEFEKYIEESNIYTVRLDDTWWNDPHAKTMPSVHHSFRDTHRNEPKGWSGSVNSSYPGPTRKDGFVPVVSYKLQPQAWENAHVYDHKASNGTLKDRRWAEGSTTIRRTDSSGNPVYFLTYSANNYQSPDYGVGYTYADKVTGPYYKSGTNPILSQDTSRNIYSTGHGSIIAAAGSNNKELFYPHHARPTEDATRYLYTSRLFVEPDNLYMAMGPAAGDVAFPSNTAPLKIQSDPVHGADNQWDVTVQTKNGAAFDLSSPLNRVQARVVGKDADQVQVSVSESRLAVSGLKSGINAQIEIVYQRARSNNTLPWADVMQSQGISAGAIVMATVQVQ